MLQKLAIITVLVGITLYIAQPYFNGPMCESKARLDGKTVIVTGSNTGIGKETVRDLVHRGGRVIMACRSLEKCERSAQDIRNIEKVDSVRVSCMELDLGSFKSIRQFAEEFNKKEKRLDILINNAGIMMTPYSKTEDGLEVQIGVNHFGHFLLTHLLLDKLKASAPSRVVSVTSSGHVMNGINFDDMHYEKEPYNGLMGSTLAYAQSKSANILFMHHLAKELKGTGVTTYSAHPGGIRTELTRHAVPNERYIEPMYILLSVWSRFWKDVEHGAQTSVCCAVDEALANVSGKYYADCAEGSPAAHAIDDEIAKRLWDISMKTVGLK